MKRTWKKMNFWLVAYFFAPVLLYANSDTCPAGQICNPLTGASTIPDLIKQILTGALRVGIPIVALAIIYSGFLFVAARGNSEKLTKAKDTLLYTLIGAAILLGAWAIATLISNTITKL